MTLGGFLFSRLWTITATAIGLSCLLLVAPIAQEPGQNSFPTGSFDAGSLTLTFNANGTHTLADRGNIVVNGTYVVQGDQITLTDKSGDFACDEVGKYQWTYDGKALRFKALLDDCGGRADGLTQQPWVRK